MRDPSTLDYAASLLYAESDRQRVLAQNNPTQSDYYNGAADALLAMARHLGTLRAQEVIRRRG